MSHKQTLPVSYLESYFNDLQRWLSAWRITINFFKSTRVDFARAERGFIHPRPVTHFGETIQWDDTTRYLRVTLDTRLNWSCHINQVRKRSVQMMCVLGPLNRKSELFVGNGVLTCKQLIRLTIEYECPARRSDALSVVRMLHVLQFKCLRLLWNVSGGGFTRIWVFRYLPRTSKP